MANLHCLAQPDAVMSPVVDRPERRLSFFLRLRSFCGRARFQGSFVRASTELVLAWVRARKADARERHNREPRLARVRFGTDALAESASVAIYVHYAPAATVSEMVFDQLRAYRALGFRILFVSMAPALPPDIVARLSACVALIVQRRNVGLDFGAWQDMLPFLAAGPAPLRELLLVNDSVCGPLRPLSPLVADMRDCGPGFFGMTESIAPTPHLQSYFLLARGEAAIADTVEFLTAYQQTAYKRRVVRRGEIGLTRWMRDRGHVVAARFGYQQVERAALTSVLARRRLRRMFPQLLAGVGDDDAGDFARRLRHHPLNPAHSLWRELVDICGFPFFKTELFVRNPIGVTDLENWRRLVPAEAVGLRAEIEAHFAVMRPSPHANGSESNA